MNSIIDHDILYSDACLVYITTGIVCAVVRWAHMCRQCQHDPDWYYPARRQLTFFYAAIAMQLPYVLWPADDGVWAYARTFGIIYYPVCFTLLLTRFFRRRHITEQINLAYFGVSMAVLVSMLAASCWRGPWLAAQWWWLMPAAGVCSLLLTARLAIVTRWLLCGINRFHADNYSADDDFPYVFAKRVIWLPMAWIGLMWVVFAVGNRGLKAAADIVLSVLMVVYLCIVLHPQRDARPCCADTAGDADGDGAADICPPSECADASAPTCEPAVRAAVVAVVLRRFREPHLLKTEVLADIDRGMAAPASRFIASVGYYRLVNMFRLRHAMLYARAHPGAKQAEVAAVSGFLSDQALSRAKKNVADIDLDLVRDVCL